MPKNIYKFNEIELRVCSVLLDYIRMIIYRAKLPVADVSVSLE